MPLPQGLLQATARKNRSGFTVFFFSFFFPWSLKKVSEAECHLLSWFPSMHCIHFFFHFSAALQIIFVSLACTGWPSASVEDPFPDPQQLPNLWIARPPSRISEELICGLLFHDESNPWIANPLMRRTSYQEETSIRTELEKCNCIASGNWCEAAPQQRAPVIWSWNLSSQGWRQEQVFPSVASQFHPEFRL